MKQHLKTVLFCATVIFSQVSLSMQIALTNNPNPESTPTSKEIIARQASEIATLKTSLRILKAEQSAQCAIWDTIQAGWPLENEQLQKKLEQVKLLLEQKDASIATLSTEKKELETKHIELMHEHNQLHRQYKDMYRTACELNLAPNYPSCKETHNKLAPLLGPNGIAIGYHYKLRKI